MTHARSNGLARLARLCALALLASGLSGAPADDLEALVRDGMSALGSGDFAVARENLEAASRLVPEEGRIWLALARVYQRSGDVGQAEEALDKVGGLAKEQPELCRGLAFYFQQIGRFEDAAQWEGRYALFRPGDPEPLSRAAHYYLAADLPGKAVEFAESAVEKRQDSAELHNLLGKALAESGRTDDALTALGRAIELNKYNEDFHYDRGYAYLRAQRFEEALTAFHESRQLFDKSPRLELGIGIAHYGQRSFSDAITSFLRASVLAPNAPQPHYFLGKMLTHASDRIDKVLERFEAFHKAQPENYLGSLLHAQGLVAAMGPDGQPEVMDQVEQLLTESVSLKEDFWETHFELGALLEKSRRFEEAERSLLRAGELNPGASKIQYRLARVYARLGKTDLAAAAREKHAQLTEAEREAMSGDPEVAFGQLVE